MVVISSIMDSVLELIDPLVEMFDETGLEDDIVFLHTHKHE